MIIANIFADFAHFILHMDEYLKEWVTNYNTLTYAILFLIIFVETGLVVMPFLPGDSLLFAAGAVAATTGADVLNIWFLIPLLFCAAIMGDNLNYFIGSRFGVKIFEIKSRFIKREYLTKTEAFFEKHGGKTIIMARFVPIIRTFTPFVAGVGTMKYSKFILNCVAGGILWVSGLTLLGYFFGSQTFVKNNFELVILGIIGISLLPVIYQLFANKKK